MRLNIVMGFFLPVPPRAGGATEKTWYGLSREFAARGHQVTVLSRQWPDLAGNEIRDGVHHLRLPGYAHTSRLPRNLWLDLRWSWRIWRHLPPADITVVNCVALPAWLGWFPRQAGRVVVLPGRMPKGQFRIYRRLHRVLAVSSVVRSAILAENPRLAPLIRLSGYPINYRLLAEPPREPSATAPLTIGYVGRLHQEKGLELLVEAIIRLAKRGDLPAWRLLICGPADVSRGGSGMEFLCRIEQRLTAVLPPDQFKIHAPEFSEERLAAIYREIDVFCYPSLAMRGETFGVAVLEAMAAGAVPIVSGLPSFADFVRNDESGVIFDHHAADAAERLSQAMTGLIGNTARLHRLAVGAQAVARSYDYTCTAERMLADFSTLLPVARR